MTARCDELTPGPDHAAQETARRIEAHARAVIGRNPRQEALRTRPRRGTPPGCRRPGAVLAQAWMVVGTAPQTTVADFQGSAQGEFYARATIGVVPSGLPSLHSSRAAQWPGPSCRRC